MFLVVLTSLFYAVGSQDYDVLILGAGASGLCKKKACVDFTLVSLPC